MKKRMIAWILALALGVALTTPWAAAGSFPDIGDPVIAEAAEVLHALGVVGGVGGGRFQPEGTFDRASFCKMALIMMDRGGEAALQASRVIFSDVTARHWALGYVNAAASAPSGGGTPLVRGTGTGLFQPDKPITYGEAIAILMRVLGYTDSDVALAGAWYAGYLLRADTIGLTEGISRGGEDTLTRAEAALLFYNLLFVSPKGKSEIYLAEVLGGSMVQSTIILSLDERAVRTMAGSYPITRAPLPGAVTGVPVYLCLDRDGRVLTALPMPDITSRTVRILVAEGRYIIADGNERISIPGDTPVLRPDEEHTTYSAIYTDLPSGTSAILSYNLTGELVYIYLPDAGHGITAMSAKTVNDLTFSTLIGTKPAHLSVYKNGASATLSDVRLYDVGVYYPDAAMLRLSDRRLTGVFENLSPSPTSPETVTVMGAEFSVLDCAVADLASFRLGDAITLLLTEDNKVAGAVTPDAVRGTVVGPVSLEGDIATVTLTFGVTVNGTVTLSEEAARTISGKLVRVTSPRAGRLSLSPVGVGEVSGAWDVTSGKLGTLPVSNTVSIYERAGDSRLYPVERSAVTASLIPASKLLYAGTSPAGEVDTLILDDVTGDCYTYGLADVSIMAIPDGGMTTYNTYITVTNSKTALTLMTDGSAADFHEQPTGVIPSLSLRRGSILLARSAPLTAVKGVPRSAFRDGYVTIGSTRYPIAANIDDHCYNSFAKAWFADLAAARAYAISLTVYYDKAPELGGKIRLVVVE